MKKLGDKLAGVALVVCVGTTIIGFCIAMAGVITYPYLPLSNPQLADILGLTPEELQAKQTESETLIYQGQPIFFIGLVATAIWVLSVWSLERLQQRKFFHKNLS